MQRAFEKIIERLEEEKTMAYNTYKNYEMKVDLGRAFGVENAIEIVNQVASECDGWIPVSERLPEDNARVLTTIKTDKGSLGVEDCWYSGIDKCFKTYVDLEPLPPQIEVIAWQSLPTLPLPEPYKAESEE
jgi:hypothetical protein|nr:MAG TPA: Protein of unknown function (DUF551) [Caudoviricetes sp.]